MPEKAPHSRQAGAEIEVTPQMIEAGRIELLESGILPFGGELGCEGGVAASIYRAMWAVRTGDGNARTP